MVVLGGSRPVFIFTCENCKSEIQLVSKKNIIRCLICDSVLCNNCNKYGFCQEHYNSLSPQNQETFHKLEQNVKKEYARRRETLLFVWLGYIICIIITQALLYSSREYTYVSVFISLSIFIVLIGSFLYANSYSNTYLITKNEKLKILSIKTKFCAFCGNNVIPDSKYCDKCGKAVIINYEAQP